MTRLRHYLHTNLYLDLRSLALMRIFMGALLVFDSACRIPNLESLYSDLGVLTRVDLINYLEVPFRMSLLMLNGSWDWAFIVSLIGIISGLFVMVGYKSNCFIFLGWLSLCAFHARNPLVAHGGDNLLRISFFWGFFLPLAKVWSLDQVSNKNSKQSNLHSHDPFCIAFILQVSFIYIFTVLYKVGPDWLTHFNAFYYAIELDSFVTPIGSLLQGHPSIGKALTLLTIFIEALGPLLILIPSKKTFFRGTAVTMFLALHIGIALMFHVGIFSMAGVTIWLALIPSQFWTSKLLVKIQKKAMNRLKVDTTIKAQSETRVSRDQAIPHVGRLYGATSLIALVLAWNIEGLRYFKNFDIKSPLNEIVFSLQLNQQWNMFAPSPTRNDGWFVLEASLENGTLTDVFNPNRAISTEKPAHMAQHYPDSQWRKFLLNLLMEENEYFRGRLLNYFCNKWNHKDRNDDSKYAREIHLVFMREYTLDPGNMSEAKVERLSLWTKTCQILDTR